MNISIRKHVWSLVAYPMMWCIDDQIEIELPRFYYKATRRFMEDYDWVAPGYKKAYFEFATDTTLYVWWPFVWCAKLYWYWRMNRWNIERYLFKFGILYTDEDCGYFRDRKMNWNWRWYDKSTWYNHL